MANYVGSARSTYFQVKDEDAFRAAMDELPDLEVVAHGEGEARHVALLAQTDCGIWPKWHLDDPDAEEEQEDKPIDLLAEIAPHLREGSIAVLFEVGAEALRYVGGHAMAVNAQGEVVHLNLADIFELAESKLGGTASQDWY